MILLPMMTLVVMTMLMITIMFIVDDNDHVEFDQKEHEVIKDERGVSATNWQIPFLEATTFHLPQFMRIYNWLLS